MNQTRAALQRLIKQSYTPQTVVGVIEEASGYEYTVTLTGGTGDTVTATTAKRTWWRNLFGTAYKVGDRVLVTLAEGVAPIIVAQYEDEKYERSKGENSVVAAEELPNQELTMQYG